MEGTLDRLQQKNRPFTMVGGSEKNNLDTNDDNINLLRIKSQSGKNEVVGLIYLALKAEDILKNVEGKDTVSKVRNTIGNWG